MSRRHVVLLTYGEPPVASLGSQLRYSWRILLGLTRSVADIPALLLPFIAMSRAVNRVVTWRRERFESPLEPLTRAQTDKLRAALAVAAPQTEWRVHIAYEFRDPLLTDVIASLPEGEVVDVIPMYAADSAFTHELARVTLAGRPEGWKIDPRVLPPLPIAVQAELAARHVRAELRCRGWRVGEDTALLLAAHGTLLDPPRPYETGRLATEQLADAIAKQLATEFGTIALGWLNHSFGGSWTEPPADLALRRIADRGFRRVVYFPFGFLTDNAETLLEGRVALRTQPGIEAIHLPCLNTAPELMTALARQVVLGMEAPGDASPRRLDQLEPGERTVIVALDGDAGHARRLRELGLVPGTPIEVVRRAPFGDPVEFRVRDVSLSLRRSETRRIHVAPH